MAELVNVADPGTGRDAFAVTPDDAALFTTPARALWVGSAGDVTILTRSDAVVTFASVAAGTLLPIACKRVNETGTDATDIVGLV